MAKQIGGDTLNITMRPSTFDEVIGLETQVTAIRNKIAQGVPRAFLLTGPFGCGKTTLAYIIAKDIQGWEFTGQPQVQEINAADVTGIDAMRKLVDDSGSYPMVGKYSVTILDEAHKLSKPAQECLLKVFEDGSSPTVWIICTTDPDKLIPGIRAGRCFTQQVEPMQEPQIRTLITRAVERTHFTGDAEAFIRAVVKAQIGSGRKILMAFEAYQAGTPLEKAVAGMIHVAKPEYFEIAMAVVFGKWDADASIWGGSKQLRAIGSMLKDLDDGFKKKKADDSTEETEGQLDDEDLETDGKQAAAISIKLITAGFLKGQMLPTITKGKQYKHKAEQQAARAYRAIHVLVNTAPVADAYGMEWPGLVAALFRVNQIMQGKQ